MLCWAYIFHADALREWNRLDEALELALQGVRLSEQTETIVALYLGCTILMRIYLARREMDAARLAFQKAEEALAKTYSPYRRDAYLIVHWMQFWVASGEQERWCHVIEIKILQALAQALHHEDQQALLAAFSHRSTTHAPLTPGSGESRGYIREQPLIEPLSELTERPQDILFKEGDIVAHGEEAEEDEHNAS
jgi:hypothetical protein